jgi:hypothetical protein
MYAEEPFPHPGAFGSSGTVERKQGFGSRFDSGSLQPRGEQDLGGFFACKGKGLTKFTSMPVCALKVRFVDQYNVGQFEQTGLFGLYAIATCWAFDNHNSVGYRSTTQLGLA